MANSYTKTFDALFTTTLEAYQKQLYDNIFKDEVFFKILHNKGKKRTQKGGERIIVPLMYGKNTTFGSISGAEVVDTSPQEGLTVAYYTWRTVAGSVTITDDEKSDNSGDAQILSLLEIKVKQGELSMKDVLANMLLGSFSAGNGGKDIDPLPLLVRYNITASAEIGGLDQSTYTWWRNQTADSGATTYKGLLQDMRNMYNDCTKGGGGSPDVVLCEQIAFETYENAMQEYNRISQTQNANVGYERLRFKGAEVVWDERVPDAKNASTTITDSTMYFLNTDYIELVAQEGRDLRTKPFVTPDNSLVSTSLIDFRGNLCLSNRRKQGVLGGISTSIVA